MTNQKITLKMAKAARIAVNNPGLPQCEILQRAGYAKATARKPGEVFDNPRFLAEVARLQVEKEERDRNTEVKATVTKSHNHITDDALYRQQLQDLADDPNARHADRIRALELIGKLDGRYLESRTAAKTSEGEIVARIQAGRARLKSDIELGRIVSRQARHVAYLEDKLAEHAIPFDPWQDEESD